jgi:hypothetical protein
VPGCGRVPSAANGALPSMKASSRSGGDVRHGPPRVRAVERVPVVAEREGRWHPVAPSGGSGVAGGARPWCCRRVDRPRPERRGSRRTRTTTASHAVSRRLSGWTSGRRRWTLCACGAGRWRRQVVLGRHGSGCRHPAPGPRRPAPPGSGSEHRRSGDRRGPPAQGIQCGVRRLGLSSGAAMTKRR